MFQTIVSIKHITVAVVETTDREFPLYYRFAADDWRNYMGGDIVFYYGAKELEKMYQERIAIRRRLIDEIVLLNQEELKP